MIPNIPGNPEFLERAQDPLDPNLESSWHFHHLEESESLRICTWRIPDPPDPNLENPWKFQDLGGLWIPQDPNLENSWKLQHILLIQNWKTPGNSKTWGTLDPSGSKPGKLLEVPTSGEFQTLLIQTRRIPDPPDPKPGEFQTLLIPTWRIPEPPDPKPGEFRIVLIPNLENSWKFQYVGNSRPS
ncbi:hypothetical protein HGM15179_018011 [Zosterops borbonicus]|uniref:Uncharacterized protein n=1 Tax=Zosterops borbonicus TaxID=364589 RepID=A0A8K1FZT9_9PASS|nr:hypothetical protein HGM15179_018011 [Zosterops borbonicus]